MRTTEGLPSYDVSNVWNEEKRQQVIALGRLGWPLRRIEKETGVRRETAGTYLKAVGIAIRPAGAWGRRGPAKPACWTTISQRSVQIACARAIASAKSSKGWRSCATR